MDDNNYDPYDLWNESLYDYEDVDAQALAAANFTAFDEASPSDPKVKSDVTIAKATATANGQNKLANTLDFILKYGDKALTILSKAGIIKNQNLNTAGYSAATLAALTADTTTTSNAPAASNRVFNIDFTDPKVLIITFLLLMILFYFLFFNSSKNAKR